MDRARTTARSGLRLRRSAQDGAIVDTLPLGTDVEVVQRETWVRVRTASGETGWVLGDYLEHAASEDDAGSRADAEATAAPAEAGSVDASCLGRHSPCQSKIIPFFSNIQKRNIS